MIHFFSCPATVLDIVSLEFLSPFVSPVEKNSFENMFLVPVSSTKLGQNSYFFLIVTEPSRRLS